MSEGWIKVAAGRSRDRYGNPMTLTLKGKVEPYYEGREPPTEKPGRATSSCSRRLESPRREARAAGALRHSHQFLRAPAERQRAGQRAEPAPRDRRLLLRR